MIPIRLHLSGFLSYLDPVDVDFESFDLACISGQNGAGKSSLLDAITWSLFGEARRHDDSIINSQAEAAEVIFTFSYENNLYRVQRSKPRGKTTLLEFAEQDKDGYWRPLTEATLHATEEHIVKTLRLDYETFINASFFLQGKADQFSQQRPGDRKRILSNTLGLEIWETYKEEALRRRREAENQTLLKDSRLAEIEEELAKEDERQTALELATKQYEEQKTLAENLKARFDQQNQIHERYEREGQQLQKQQAEIKRQQAELDEQNHRLLSRQQERAALQGKLSQEPEIDKALAQWQSDQKKLEELDALAARYQTLEGQRQAPLREIASQKARLETRLQALQSEAKQAESLQAALPAHQRELTALQQKLEQLHQHVESRPMLEEELRQLSDDRANTRAANQTLLAEMNGLKERIDQLSAVEGAVCPVCGKPLSEEERTQMVVELQEEGKDRGNSYRQNEATLKTYESRFHTLEGQIKILQTAETQGKELQRQVDLRQHELSQAQAQLDEWQQVGLLELQALQNQLIQEEYAQDARQQLAELEKQMKALEYDASAHAALREAEKAGRTGQNAKLELEKARASLEPLQREIDTLHDDISKREERLQTLNSELETAQKEYETAFAALPDLNALEREYYDQQQKANVSLQEMASRRSQVEVLESLKEQHKKLKAEKKELTSLIAQLKQLERAFGKDGIPALLIEQALPEIESDANDILDRLSDGNMSVHFETQREFKDKKREDRKETLDILIHDASGDRDYELFSGGEAFRINFAIRLALSRVLARRAGARLQTLVIDEGFGSQDAEGVQRLIEAINNVRGDFAKILVITHLEELKDAFSARIEVTKTERGSRVQVVAA